MAFQRQIRLPDSLSDYSYIVRDEANERVQHGGGASSFPYGLIATGSSAEIRSLRVNMFFRKGAIGAEGAEIGRPVSESQHRFNTHVGGTFFDGPSGDPSGSTVFHRRVHGLKALGLTGAEWVTFCAY